MAEALKCEKSIRRDLGKDNSGSIIYASEKCGQPASECEVGGTLARARAILCDKHKEMADRELFTSAKGYPLGKVDDKAKDKKYMQQRLPGTGVL